MRIHSRYAFELLKLKNKKKKKRKKRGTEHLTPRTGRKFLSVPVRATSKSYDTSNTTSIYQLSFHHRHFIRGLLRSFPPLLPLIFSPSPSLSPRAYERPYIANTGSGKSLYWWINVALVRTEKRRQYLIYWTINISNL